MKYSILAFLLLALFSEAYCQQYDNGIDVPLVSSEMRLQKIRNASLNASSDSARLSKDSQFLRLLEETLQQDVSFSYPFDSLNSISILRSEDSTLRIYTWTLPHLDGTYSYSGLIQLKNSVSSPIQVLKLNDQSNNSEKDFAKLALDAEHWYGSLYYDIIDVEIGGDPYYTLLGWKGNNRQSTKKVIDVMQIDRNNQVIFGEPVFDRGDETKSFRVIYEFSAESSMTISYDTINKAIVCDHLFPSHPSLKGHYEFYGPDLSFDAFIFKDGIWNYEEDYDPGIRPPKEELRIKEQKPLYRPN